MTKRELTVTFVLTLKYDNPLVDDVNAARDAIVSQLMQFIADPKASPTVIGENQQLPCYMEGTAHAILSIHSD